jgi:SAM-dependent methyltransferase
MELPYINSCDRESFILDRIKGKKVLHLGCADWPFTPAKIIKGDLLHQKMLDINQDVVGLDLDSNSIRLMQESGIKNVFVGNAELSLYEVLGQKFDVIVAGEVIEHVLNVGSFLESIKTVCNKDSVLILTTVNFAPIKKLPRLLFRREVVHPDHVYYFSFSTLSCLLAKCGFKVDDWSTHWWDVGAVSKLVNKILRRIPALQYYADNFCLVCSPIFQELDHDGEENLSKSKDTELIPSI